MAENDKQDLSADLEAAYDEGYFSGGEKFKFVEADGKEVKLTYKEIQDRLVAKANVQPQPNSDADKKPEPKDGKPADGQAPAPTGENGNVALAMEMKISGLQDLYRVNKGIEVAREAVVKEVNDRVAKGEKVTINDIGAIFEAKVKEAEAEKIAAENKIVDNLKKEPSPLGKGGNRTLEDKAPSNPVDATNPLAVMGDFGDFKKQKIKT